jgi:hypothetical protein
MLHRTHGAGAPSKDCMVNVVSGPTVYAEAWQQLGWLIIDPGGAGVTKGNPWVDGAAATECVIARRWKVRTGASGCQHAVSPAPAVEPVDAEEEVEPVQAPTGPLSPRSRMCRCPRMLCRCAALTPRPRCGSSGRTVGRVSRPWPSWTRRGGSGHAWPELSTGAVAPCIVVARTNVRGLLAARSALTQWAASGAGASVQLLGLVLVADAPGKLPRRSATWPRSSAVALRASGTCRGSRPGGWATP